MWYLSFFIFSEQIRGWIMRKYWYRRILIMVAVFAMAVGGSYYLIETRNQALDQTVSAAASDKMMVIPGGMPVGIYLETEGVMILGTGGVESVDGMTMEPAKNLVKAGDYIKKIDNQKVETKAELIDAISHLDEDEVILQINRAGEEIDIKIEAVECRKGEYKLGIWVRDNAQGLGTITFLTTESRFGALGHGIHDVDTNKLLEISGGRLYTTSIKDIQKGEYGVPGGLEGIIVYNNYNMLGTIEKNTEAGIFGEIDRIDTLFTDQTPVEVAAKEEIEEGKAIIRCAVEGEVKEYAVEIKKVDLNCKEVNKGILLEITDEKLLKVTGGIVQGMSGSPILQNGKIVGAVTHVLVNDPTRGYGIFIENMLDAAA